MEPAGKQEVLRLQPRPLDPRLHGIASSLRYLELHWTQRLVLHDDGARGDLFTVAYVPDLQRNEIAASQLAVHAQIEESEFAHPAFHL